VHKLVFAGLFATLLATSSAAETQLEIYIVGMNPQVDSAAVYIGQLKATDILASRGVLVKFFRGKPSHCVAANTPRRIVLEIENYAPRQASPIALALTSGDRCPSPSIRIFWDRIRAMETYHPVAHGQFIGYVLAHEILHATGMMHHDDEGLMKAIWSRDDIWDMEYSDDETSP
jgi:hypothetical protein